MKCSLCGLQFTEKDGKAICDKCHLFKGCELIKCPNCGFEMAPDPEWIKRLKNKRKKK